jgi:uncharacterized protein
MIIDVHGHVGPWFFSTEVGDVSENLRVMDAYGIDIQLVSGVEAVVYDPLSGNRRLVDQISAHPRLKGLFVVDPRELDLAERELSRLLPSGVFVGGKIHSQYARTPGGSLAMREALRMLAAHDLPVLVHTWGDELVGLADNVSAVEGAVVVAAHMGGPDWQLVPEAATRTDRIWFEPCYSSAPFGRIRWVVDRVGPERLLFGSDATLIDPAVTLGSLRAAELAEAESAMIMAENAKGIFALVD